MSKQIENKKKASSKNNNEENEKELSEIREKAIITSLAKLIIKHHKTESDKS